jgi:hypothetical protein
MTLPTTIRLPLAAGLLALAACHASTAPAETPAAVCSVRLPDGWLCIRPCTALTQPWAASVGLPFTPTDACAGVPASPSVSFSPSRR